ncbi:MAG TPA: decarboxylase [Casimicrobiaceae bacterium]|nr:decarboxylase [Casimicrobiaceae bacterium]
MAKPDPADRIDYLFAAPEARLDRWRDLLKAAQGCAAGAAGARENCTRFLDVLLPYEDYFAFPGPRLVGILKERMASGDTIGTLRTARRISAALMSRAYREGAAAWDEDDDVTSVATDAAGSDFNGRPYFEVLFVVPSAQSQWPQQMRAIRKLSRPQDAYVYEPVFVGSFEDAMLAIVLNPKLQSVVIYEGFQYASSHRAPLLRKILAETLSLDPDKPPVADFGLTLTRAIKVVRPELDIFLLDDSRPEELVSDPASHGLRRIFYEVEEPFEVHLSILEGVDDRVRTPYFDNLKRYAQKPVGTFHALPVARGKSIFKSDWIRDMGEFYGPTLFLAESSATTGGLDSLLEPTGNVKLAQEAAARAFGADHVFFVTNGTSTSNKMVYQALCVPGDIAIVDRNCHKSHHYGMVQSGAQPLYVEAYPLTQYSMYGAVPLAEVKKAMLGLKAEGRLDRLKIISLTNVTFDGQMYDTRRVMEECLAIKPDVVFLWDEAWFGFARFSWLYRPRTAMGARAALKSAFKDPAYLERYLAQEKKLGADLDPKDKRVLETRLIPDPRKAKLRVYQTNSTHKSMSSLRQGSMVLVGDEDFHKHEQPFKEAIFTHASTSPNLQIIATLDVARRQMELEGYELVTRAIALAIEIRKLVNTHPLVSKYFRVLTPEDMIPAQFRPSGFKNFYQPGVTWADALNAYRQDEFVIDPTRLTLVCGTAGFDGTQFKGLLASEYEIQLNKTSRNSILLQTNINNTRSDVVNLMRVLLDISHKLEKRLTEGGESERAAFAKRVKSLMTDVPDLPNFSRFHDHFREDPSSVTSEGDMRTAFYMAYDEEGCEHIPLTSPEIDRRIKEGPPMVSAHFVIPYPPGFPIMVPGQVIEKDTIDFMRKLDVKEIHGYDATLGLKLIKSDRLGTAKARPAAKPAAKGKEKAKAKAKAKASKR